MREEISEVARQMITSGLVTGTSGNVSARTPEGNILITPSGLDYSVLEPEDVALVDIEGRVLEGAFEPSTETPMHMGIYRSRPDVGGIMHTHSPYATTLACLGWEMPPVHYMLAMLSEDGRVPLAEYATYGTEELAHNAVKALGKTRKACLLQNHGTITIGETPGKALSASVVLEDIAKIYYRAVLAGKPVLLEAEEISRVSKKMEGYGQFKPADKRE